MSAPNLQAYLYQNIPLSRAMAVTVGEVTPQSLTLAAPLAPNINHQHTLFGGSGAALCILAGWSLLHCRLRAAGLAGELLIQRQQMDYLRPAGGDVYAEARLSDEADWPRFARQLARRGRARLALRVVLYCQAEAVANFDGEYVALRATGCAAVESPATDQGRVAS